MKRFHALGTQFSYGCKHYFAYCYCTLPAMYPFGEGKGEGEKGEGGRREREKLFIWMNLKQWMSCDLSPCIWVRYILSLVNRKWNIKQMLIRLRQSVTVGVSNQTFLKSYNYLQVYIFMFQSTLGNACIFMPSS